MKRLTFYLLPLILCLTIGCRSNRDVISDKLLNVDSIARSAHHRTIVCIDSAVHCLNFDFDTLNVEIQRPSSSVCDKPEFWCKRVQNGSSLPVMPSAAQNAPCEIIRLKAVRGRVIDQRRVHRDSLEVCNRLDTVAYHQSAAETSTEHSATTRLYNPPDGTLLIGLAIVIIAGGYILYIRTRA